MAKNKNDEIYYMVLRTIQGYDKLKEPKPTKEQLHEINRIVENDIKKFKQKVAQDDQKTKTKS